MVGCRSGFGGGGHADKRSPCSEVTNACPILKEMAERLEGVLLNKKPGDAFADQGLN